MYDTVYGRVLFVVTILALTVGVVLIGAGTFLMRVGKAKEQYPASLIQRLGTAIAGTAVGVLIIILAFD